MKKIVLLSVMVLSLFSSSLAFAESNSIEDLKASKAKEVVAKAFEVGPDGKLYEVDVEKVLKEEEESKRFLNSESIKGKDQQDIIPSENQEVSAFALPYTFQTYKEETNYIITGLRQKVSNELYCNSSTACSIAVGWAVTTTSEYGANIDTGSERDAVRAGVSFTWSNSNQSSTTYTLPIDPGKKAYVGFIPKYNYTSGTLTHWYNNGLSTTITGTEFAWAKSPRKMGSETEGTYLLVYTN